MTSTPPAPFIKMKKSKGFDLHHNVQIGGGSHVEAESSSDVRVSDSISITNDQASSDTKPKFWTKRKAIAGVLLAAGGIATEAIGNVFGTGLNKLLGLVP